MVSSVAGLVVFLLFLLLAVQVLVGLYATSTLRATLHDAASRAANAGAADPADLERLAAAAERSLGGMGDRTEVVLRLEDDDGDGVGDVVAGRAVAVPPRVMPSSVGGMLGFERITVAVRVRVERVR
jgi:hypothetical protein